MCVQKNIKRIRLARGIKQKAISNYLNISEMKYSRIENSNKKIDSKTLEKIAQFLNVNANIFFDDKITESVIKRYLHTPCDLMDKIAE
ncbi:XRE family transcriptional regulator [Bombilactobacillus bombi]|uniref:helix-turn-helix domain-containing protein n=1 Tax=Bombilactobacillus bombi TaxID=1303590 RepID=UPI000E5965CC|nr:helix-turn-helix transcriptional regulator [Bombilactobacillus bombi]AXX65549.1 XRE family transcriptional regulator [Bombilactobacillus bombi]